MITHVSVDDRMMIIIQCILDTSQFCKTTCMSDCDFPDLRDVDSTTLPTMMSILARKAYVSTGLMTPTKACTSSGTVKNIVVADRKNTVWCQMSFIKKVIMLKCL
jgi:hypothetical protein